MCTSRVHGVRLAVVLRFWKRFVSSPAPPETHRTLTICYPRQATIPALFLKKWAAPSRCCPEILEQHRRPSRVHLSHPCQFCVRRLSFCATRRRSMFRTRVIFRPLHEYFYRTLQRSRIRLIHPRDVDDTCRTFFCSIVRVTGAQTRASRLRGSNTSTL